MTESTWHELAAETHLVIHVEQVTDGAAVECNVADCGADAVLLVTSEPDMEPGFVCGNHGCDWVDATAGMLRKLFVKEAD